MTTVKSWPRLIAAAALCCLTQAGCASHDNMFRTHPELATRSPEVRKILLVTPEVKAYQVSAGGATEHVPEWSAQAVANVTEALLTRFGHTKIAMAVLKTNAATDPELKEVRALFPVVTQSIRLHTYPNRPNYFPGRENEFYYMLGDLGVLLKPEGGDALLLVQGEDRFATAGKKTLNTLGTITGVLASAVTGVAIIPRGEGTYLEMALADREGHILWYNFKGGISDLREPEKCREFVEGALEGFPGIPR